MFRLINILFIVFLLLSPMVPRFGSIDIIGPQWFFISCLNLAFTSILIFSSYSLYIKFISSFNSYLSFSYLIFSFFCFLSVFYALNKNIAIVDFSRILITFFSIINLSFAISNSSISIKHFFLIAILIHIVELYFCFSPFFVELLNGNFSEIKITQKDFSGIAGNKNITAASLCVKLPLIFYLIINFKNLGYKIFLYFILLLSFLAIFYLNSRATFISFAIVNILMLCLLAFKGSFKILLSFLFVFITSLFLNINSPFFKSSNVLTRASSIEFSYEGSSARFELWSNALDYIKHHPLIGCGIGNWKIQSLPYWKDMMTGYIVPYHAHNDFLEVTTELGILGGLSYIIIFFFLLFLLFPKRLLDYDLTNPKIYLLLVLAVYTIDSFFNFPLERPLIQIYFMVLFSWTFILDKTHYRS